jgi:hypothetical protein
MSLGITRIKYDWNDLEHRALLNNTVGITDQTNVIGYPNDHGLMIVGLDNYSGVNIFLSVVGFGQWAKRSTLSHFFSYVFDDLGCKRASATVHPDNHKSVKMLTRLGFVKECELRGVDEHLYSLLPTDCKYYVRIIRKQTQRLRTKTG